MANQVRFLDQVAVSAFGNTGGTETTNTSSLLLTASAATNVITFTKGDGSTFPVTVDTGSASSAFPFIGNAVITGSLTVSGSNSVVNLQELQFNTDHSQSGHTTGRMYWDDSNKTITIDMQGSDVRLQVGQEEHVYAKNTSGVVINNGDAVRITGAVGANVTIEKAVSSIKSFKDTTEKDQILGVATEQITDNQSGYITTFGAVRDLNTSAFTEGDILYLSNTTSGSYTNVRPPAPNFEARVGVVQVANATEGIVLVRPQEPTFLTDISQITASGVITNEKTYLCYDDNTDLISFTNAFSGSFSGSFQGDGSGLTGVGADTGSLMTTASVSLNTITFTKGDGSTFPITVDTGSGGGGGGGSSAGTSNEFQITDNAGGFVTSILQETGGQIGAGGVTVSAVFSLSSIVDRGFIMPSMTTVQQNAISTPATGLEIYNTDVDAPMYNHSVDGWIPTGRYAITGSVIAGGASTPTFNNMLASANSDGELAFAPFRWGTGGGAYFHATDTTGAFTNSTVQLGAGSTARWGKAWLSNVNVSGVIQTPFGYIKGQTGVGQLTIGGNLAGSLDAHASFVNAPSKIGLAIRDDGATFNNTINIDPTAILDLTSTTRGFLPPRMTIAQRTAIASPITGLQVHTEDGTDSIPYYNHSIDGWIPVGRYSGNPNTGTGAKNGQIMASNLDGELIAVRLVGVGSTIYPANSSGNYSNNSVNLGSSGQNFLYGFFNRTYVNQVWIGGTGLGIITANSGTGAGMRFSSFSAGLTNNFMKLHGETAYKGLSVRDTDIATNDRIETTAVMELQSTTRGFLPPRMTSAQMGAIANTEGLIVHNNDADRPHYNDGSSWKGFGDLYGLYSQTVQSTTVTNTTTETTIIGTGVGSLSIPANGFKVGDSFHGKIGGVISTLNNHEITIRIMTGATVLASTGLISLEAVTALGWEIELDFTVATLGATGSICTNGNFAYNRNTGSLEGFVFQDVQTIDTTISNTLDITVEWNQTNASDEIYSANFVLYRTYAA